MIGLKVETFPGEAGTDMIRRFRLGERTREVTENIDQWYGAGYRYFKVKADDGNLYILHFDEARRDWDLTMFKPPPRVLKSLH